MVSAKLTPAARTSTTTRPGPGGGGGAGRPPTRPAPGGVGGSGRSWTCRTDGSPCLVITTARIARAYPRPRLPACGGPGELEADLLAGRQVPRSGGPRLTPGAHALGGDVEAHQDEDRDEQHRGQHVDLG